MAQLDKISVNNVEYDIGGIAVPQTANALPASNTALAPNTIYSPTSTLGTYVFKPPITDNKWAHGKFTTGASVNISFSGQFLGAAPTIKANTTYEFDVYDSTWIVQEVVTQTASFKPTASTAATSGVNYTSGLSGVAASDVTLFAEAISNNSSITNATSTVYIDFGSVHRKVSVGDQVTLALNGTNYTFDVIGFNHDTLTTSTAYGATTKTGKAGITFQMHDLFATTYVMNSSNTNSGGWKSSAMRTSTMATMKGYLPAAWQTAIKPVNKASGTGGGSSSGTETVSDSCFLLAEIEIFGSTTYSVSGEGTQYAYYKAGNSKVKNGGGSAGSWWERSPRSGTSISFCRVGSSGGANDYGAGNSSGVAFGFCV